MGNIVSSIFGLDIGYYKKEGGGLVGVDHWRDLSLRILRFGLALSSMVLLLEMRWVDVLNRI